METPIPSIAGIPPLSEALDFLHKAESKFILGEDMNGVVTSCRQALDKTLEVIEKKVIDLKALFNEDSLAKQFQHLQCHEFWSYKVVKELRTIKKFCGPGPHVEVPVTRSEARYALIHTTNILSYLARLLKTNGQAR